MFRRQKQSDSSMDGSILVIVFVLDSTSTSVKKVKRLSILLQPVDLSFDEETLMRIVPFWRASLNQSSSRQYYFDHFEIHPIKLNTAGSNIIFSAVMEVSDSVLKGAESSGFSGMEWRLGPTVLTLCEHLFVSFAIRMLRKQAGKVVAKFRSSRKLLTHPNESEASGSADTNKQEPKGNHAWRSGIERFVLSALVAYVDGRLCRGIPNPVARRIVSGFLQSYLDKNDSE